MERKAGDGEPVDRAVLALENLTKHFFGVHALEDVSFSIRRGTVHAVVGANGAGKSTLMKILVGVHRPDRGRVLLLGEPFEPIDPGAASAAGVDIVFQEIELANNLTVAENIFLAREPARLGWVSHRGMHNEACALLARVGLEVSPETEVGELGVAEKQLVQIARALHGARHILIMDEPTSALTDHEIERIFAVIRHLRGEGMTILYVSHKLDEVFALADDVSVLRDGRLVRTMRVRDATPDELIRLMVGEAAEAPLAQATRPAPAKPPALSVKGLSRDRAFHDVSFEVHPREIVGLFGIVGAGRTEVARAIFGLDAYDRGSVELLGRPLPPRAPAVSVRAGLGLLPEDRKLQGLLLELSVRWNTSLAALPRLSRWGVVPSREEYELVREEIRRLGIVAANTEMEARNLSGGNQQKVVLGKWLAVQPKVLILDEPVKGIDVGAKAEIHRLIRELADEGLAILLISSELDEIINVCDRVLVLHAGRLTAELSRADMTREGIMRHAVSLANDASV